MAIKTPIKATFTGSDVTGLAEFQSTDFIGVANGGTGVSTLTGIVLGNGTNAFSSVTDGNNGQVLTTDGNGTYTFETPASSISLLTDVTLTNLVDGEILKYDSATSAWINSSETVTSLTIANNIITYVNESGTQQTIDLSPYLDEDARAIASGTLNSSTGIVTFTRDDATTFTLDLSGLLDDTNLVTSVNGAQGVVVLDTDDISEGSTNLYYTDARVNTHLNTSTATTNYVLSWNGADYVWVDNAGYTNSDVDTHLNTSTASANDVLIWNGSDYAWQAAGSGSGNSLVSSNTTHTITLEDTGELTLQSDGALVNDSVALTTTTSNQTIDTFGIADYRTAKYIIQGISGSDVHATEVLITHDDNTVYTTEYATIFSNTSLFTVNASISNSNVIVTVTPANIDTTIDYTRICLAPRVLSGLEGDLQTQSGSEDLNSGSGGTDLNA